MLDFIKKLLLRKQKTFDAEELRLAFKERYHHFKLLLTANNQALEIMAEMEEALKGERPFGMTFVRERCTRVSTNVYQIIKQLVALSPGKYEVLHERFLDIQERIHSAVKETPAPAAGPLVLSLNEIDYTSAAMVGAKMASLGEIKNKAGMTVPDGFVVTAAGYERFMSHNDLQPEIDRKIQAAASDNLDNLHTLSAGLQQLIIKASVPPDLEHAIQEHYQVLTRQRGREPKIAMRSSALGEDLHRTTFAGQYRSALNVTSENLLHAYKEVVASKYSLPAMAYRLNRGIRDEDVAMCVGCMEMVDAMCGGVLYSRDPVHMQNPFIIINSAWGLPKLVVDGSAEVDNFIISRDPLQVKAKQIPLKRYQYVCYPDEGVCRRQNTNQLGLLPSLTDEQALELSKLAIRLEEYYQIPQDIEWCLDHDGKIIILQCRALKRAPNLEPEEKDSAPESAVGAVLFEQGVIASSGVAAGPVFVIQRDSDMLQFPTGAVLVAEQALPRWATLLQRCAAVITEYGSVTGHLANVSREFGVPALFSVKGAATLLQPGQMITVDAHGGKVYDGRIFDLLKKRPKAANLMEGSPIYEILKDSIQLIVPLNLLDPDALSFKPENCRTLHDITRFSHEKAVAEMLNFGKNHHFPERSSKRLIAEVPMQWWVLNLDDGFKEEVEGRYVRLDNIISVPMLALWEGITAVPWTGPPPIDAKGLASVMFQATQNPALIPGLRSKYADRHYFMISRDYCCMNSRLGFHFSTVETVISDRFGESYISFHFKGGAADFERRRKRIFFVKEILEGYHFRVEVKGDNLMARLEGYDKELMLRNLKIIGYLAIHTRQLDMIMENPALVKFYRNKMCQDIQNLFVREKILYLALGDENKQTSS